MKLTFIKRTIILLFIFLVPFFCFAQDLENPYRNLNETKIIEEVKGEGFFEAKVIEILEEIEKQNDKGQKFVQQNIKLIGLSDSFKNKEIIFYGIGDIEVASIQKFKLGDKVIVVHDKQSDGSDVFYITDFSRTNSIYFLIILFIVIIIFLGKWKGLRSVLSLFITFLIILKLIIPFIIKGYNPIFIAILGSLLILIFIIYLTEGFNKKSHLAVLSILISLTIVSILSIIFTELMKLNGLSEESVFLISLMDKPINFQGLLFAGVLIGSLGVLDDMVVSQISAVEQIKNNRPEIQDKQLFRSAYEIGVSHISSMANTLFLAYAGASMSLLLLFSMGDSSPFSSLSEILNNNLIATEIFRTFIGAIGLLLSMPISTFLAVKYLKRK